ncbi:MAG: rfaE bifunctional protein nucleotidyltransferase chain/domain [Glaciecola sp.]|jgi:rfaE bifunctional protein nucleotidyltransferase chain/domain
MFTEKVLDTSSIKDTLTSITKEGKSIVFTNGCFDIMHPGHVAYLEEAKKLGDILIIGINSDESIKRIKGNSRPINDFFFRSSMLAALESVNYVLKFDENTPLHLIKLIKPAVLVKGDDYSIENIVGGQFVKSIGGKVCTIAFLPGYSSSAIISKIQGLT